MRIVTKPLSDAELRMECLVQAARDEESREFHGRAETILERAKAYWGFVKGGRVRVARRRRG